MRKSRAVEDHSAPISEEITSKLGRILQKTGEGQRTFPEKQEPTEILLGRKAGTDRGTATLVAAEGEKGGNNAMARTHRTAAPLSLFLFSLRLGWKGCGLRRSTWRLPYLSRWLRPRTTTLRRIMATPKLHALCQPSLFTLRDTSCIFSRCRRGRDRCGPLSRRFGEQPSVLRLVLLRD